MEAKRQPTNVTHMLSDPMWVLSENIVVDRIAKKVAEEPLGSGMLSAPMCLGWRKKSKARMAFYRIHPNGKTSTINLDLDRKPQHVIDEERGDEIRQLRKEQAQMEMYDDPYLNWSGNR